MPENEGTVAVIEIAPAKDIAIQSLYNESCALRTVALGRVITTNEDLNPATEDLSLIAKRIQSARLGENWEGCQGRSCYPRGESMARRIIKSHNEIGGERYGK